MANRYSAQLSLKEIGTLGQQRIRNSSVLCIGAGGLANACLPALVSAGVGNITIIDADEINLSNLNRQFWFNQEDCGKPKSLLLAKRLQSQNPDCQITPLISRFNIENARDLVTRHDLVIDCCDDYPSKLLINYICQQNNRPWIYASVLGWDGQVAYFNPRYRDTPCLKCWQKSTPLHSGSCNNNGVIGAAVNLVASHQALLALQALLGEHSLAHKLWVFDLWQLENQSFLLKKSETCRYHGKEQLANQFGISYSEFLEKKDYQLIDIRTNEERERGILPDAKHVSLYSLLSESNLYFNKRDHLVIYCEENNLSRLAVANLRESGYFAWWLEGGFAANQIRE